VASVDFSHYLPRTQAEDMDELTLAALTRADWPTLFGMGPSNLDSPGALAVAFAFAGAMEQTRFQVVEHTNSAGLLGRPDLPETTSHFLLTITRTDP
jgi:AmmeMemoRadiSam system protein B